MLVFLPQIGMAILILAVIGGASELGFRFGRRYRKLKDTHFPLGAVQGGSLGLLGLLLGFAFSGASARFIERQDILVSEVNAIGTAYLRADLLPAEEAKVVRDSLMAYIEERIRLFHELDEEESRSITRAIENTHHTAWAAAIRGVRLQPESASVVLQPLNDVLDLLAVRTAATRRHLPPEVLALLVASAAISMTVIGYGAGATGSRHISVVGPLAMLIAVSLWITVDLDYPRVGLIRVSDQSLLELRESLHALRHATPSP